MPRIHVFIATSDIHLQHKLKISRTQAIEKAVAGVKMARAFTSCVDFSPEDATRSDRNFLVEILSAVIDAGADTINIPDTVGYMMPQEYGDLIGYLKANVPGIDQTIIATHCHNDLGAGRRKQPGRPYAGRQANRVYNQWNWRESWQRLP